MKRYLYFLIVFCTFSLTGCFENPEKEYKSILLNLQNSGLQLLDVEFDKCDYHKKISSCLEKNRELKKLYSKANRKFYENYYNLFKFIKKYPTGKWSDDAVFLFAFISRTIGMSDKKHLDTAIKFYEYFIEKYPNAKIEKCTFGFFLIRTYRHQPSDKDFARLEIAECYVLKDDRKIARKIYEKIAIENLNI